jgi:RimJ/RimL family protein N-acetyltransferase
MDVRLRAPIEQDFPIFFACLRDAASARMAAFGTNDSNAEGLAARWKKAVVDASTVQRAIVVDGDVVGWVASFLREGQLEVTYWVARSHWGRGIASAALAQLLEAVVVRPIHASAAKDNAASLRVLGKCGFVVCGSARAFAEARGEEIDEVFLELR